MRELRLFFNSSAQSKKLIDETREQATRLIKIL